MHENSKMILNGLFKLLVLSENIEEVSTENKVKFKELKELVKDILRDSIKKE